MASTCFSLLRVPLVRVTKLTECGVVDNVSCSSATSSGIITIETTNEVEDRQDYFTLDADGNFCIRDTKPPQLKWINVTITFCQVDPELYNLMTQDPLVLNDAASPVAVGLRTQEGSADNSNFAFEAWMRVSGNANCANGTITYGYFLFPWVTEGMIGDLTMENGAANFVVTGRTTYNSQWGTGPYNVLINETGVNANNPGPLLTAIGAADHRHLQITELPPPLVNCGCTDVTPALTVVDPGVGTTADLTIPDADLLPAVVDWDDGGPLQTLPVGTTSPVNHVYGAPGTYDVTFRSLSHSAPTYTGSVVVA